MISYAVKLYDRIIDRHTPIHRFTVTFNHVVDEMYQQYDLFSDPEDLEKERKLQKAMLDIKGKLGKNDIVTVVYFCRDEYLKQTGMVSRIDETARILKIVNTKIAKGLFTNRRIEDNILL